MTKTFWHRFSWEESKHPTFKNIFKNMLEMCSAFASCLTKLKKNISLLKHQHHYRETKAGGNWPQTSALTTLSQLTSGLSQRIRAPRICLSHPPCFRGPVRGSEWALMRVSSSSALGYFKALRLVGMFAFRWGEAHRWLGGYFILFYCHSQGTRNQTFNNVSGFLMRNLWLLLIFSPY